MPTRTGTKPSSYTFNSGSTYGANMQAGWIFAASDVSGSSITDITGNGNTLTAGTGTTYTTPDATHGPCVQPAVGGPGMNPPVSWDSFTDYSFVFGARVDLTVPGSDQYFMSLRNTAGSQDAIFMQWRTSGDVRAVVEDSDTNNVTVTGTNFLDGYAGEWVTVAAVNDTASGDFHLYVIVDGDTTQVQTLAASGISGSVLSDEFAIFGAFGEVPTTDAIGEYAYVFDTALSQADIEALHVDPYQWQTSVGSFALDLFQDDQSTAVTDSPLEYRISTASDDVEVIDWTSGTPSSGTLTVTNASLPASSTNIKVELRRGTVGSITDSALIYTTVD